METLETIKLRTSIRSYTFEPVSDKQLEIILEAAMAAPSAKNCQPWSFVAVRDRMVLNSLAERLPYAKMLFSAPLAIVVCADPSLSLMSTPDIWVQDCSAATENILLAAADMGLGSCWTAAYPHKDRAEIVSALLGLPQNIVPLNVIAVGHPSPGVSRPKDKFKKENIHYDKW